MTRYPNILKLGRERRQSERVLTYWEQKAAEFRSPPTLTQLDPGEGIDSEDWSHRFVIAPDRLAEISSFLMCGSNAGRLLELSDGPLKYTLMFRQMPKRFLELFTKGCAAASSSGSPVKIAGAIRREDGRGELYRSVFIPVGVNLIFGAFNSIVRAPQNGSSRRPDDRFVGDIASAIREIQAAGTGTLGDIAAALNARGFRTVRDRNWTAATVRSLLLRMTK
jgi:hypothetical protein